MIAIIERNCINYVFQCDSTPILIVFTVNVLLFVRFRNIKVRSTTIIPNLRVNPPENVEFVKPVNAPKIVLDAIFVR